MNGQFEIGDLSPPTLFVGISAVLGILFAFLLEAPNNVVLHFIQWQIQTTGAVLFILASHAVLFSRTTPFIANPWLRVALSGVIGALVFSPIALLSDIIFDGMDSIDNGITYAFVDEICAIVPPMTIAWLAMNSPWLMGYRLSRPSETSTIEEESLKPEPSFLSLTTVKTAKDILYIKSELHYLSVSTTDKKQLILFSLKEAISQLQLAGIDGIQCHRSYWVATSAITKAQRSGRQGVFTLSNDENVPISRTKLVSCLALTKAQKE